MEDKLKKLEKEIEEIISKSTVKIDPIHSKNTRDWLLKLKPDADKALQIAALAHDIERGFISDYESKTKEKFKEYEKHKREHSEKSAKIIGDLLKKYGFDEAFIKRVKHMVLLHEFGGDEESDLVRDADSISFFDTNLEYYHSRHGDEKTRLKIKFMFDRISERAKNIVRKKFKYNNPELNKIFREVVL